MSSKEKWRIYLRSWRAKNKDKQLIYGRRWRAKNKEKVKEIQRIWRKKNPEKMKILRKKYKMTHREKIKQLQKAHYERVKRQLFDLWGNKCKRCGFSDKRALQIDHIKGGGTQERREKKITTSQSFWAIVIKSVLEKENKYQLLCANCNWIKRVENKEFRK